MSEALRPAAAPRAWSAAAELGVLLVLGASGAAQESRPAPAPTASKPALAESRPALSADAVAAKLRPLEPETERAIAEAGLPGAGLLVLSRSGTLYEKFFGSYDESTEVALASATKWLSGATLMTLVDRKELALDDPVSRYLPEFTGDKAAITVRQLFNHTSGLPSEDTARGGPFGTLEAVAKGIAKIPLAAKPGSEFRYGSLGMQVGGRVAEVAAHASWHELFRARIAAPLGLSHTTYGKLGMTRNPFLAGGAHSTLREYGRFVRMLLCGGTLDEKLVLSKEAVAELVTDRTAGARSASFGLERLVKSAGYGVGCWVERKDKAGATQVASSPGAFGFRPWVDFERGVAVVWMIEDPEAIARAIRGPRVDLEAKINEALDSAASRPAR